jgi:hypothetical protein
MLRKNKTSDVLASTILLMLYILNEMLIKECILETRLAVCRAGIDLKHGNSNRVVILFLSRYFSYSSYFHILGSSDNYDLFNFHTHRTCTVYTGLF